LSFYQLIAMCILCTESVSTAMGKVWLKPRTLGRNWAKFVGLGHVG